VSDDAPPAALLADTAPEPTPPAPPPPLPGGWWRVPLSAFWNGRERRLRALWRLAGLLAIFALLSWLVRSLHLFPRGSGPAGRVAGTLAGTALTLVGLWIACRVLDRRRLRGLGMGLDREWLADLAFGLALGAGLMSAIFLAEWSLGWLQITGTFRTAPDIARFGLAILEPALVFLCVGITEELLARGYLLRNLAEGLAFPRLGGARGGVILAGLVSSALFGLMHADNPNATGVSTLNIAIAGGLLALPYLLTGRLGLSIGLHITWNFFQGSVFGFPVSGTSQLQTAFLATAETGPDAWTGGPFGPEAGLLALAAMLTGAAMIVLWVRARAGHVRLATALAEPPLRPPSAAAAPDPPTA